MYLPAALAILAGLTISIVYSPLDLVLQIDSSRTPAFRIRVSWLFGLVSKEASHTGRTAGRKAARRSHVGRRFLRDRKWRRVTLRMLRTRGILRQTTRLLKDLVTRIKIREVEADLDVGLGDPADTGILFAILGPLALLLNSLLPNGGIGLKPDFTPQPVLAGYSRLEMRLWPIRFVSPVMRFALSRSGMRTARVLLFSR